MDLDELERLRDAAEKQMGRRELGSTYLYETDVDAYMTALRNHAEELIRDARRYRWLRDVATSGEWEAFGLLPAIETDDAIDYSIAQEGKGWTGFYPIASSGH